MALFRRRCCGMEQTGGRRPSAIFLALGLGSHRSRADGTRCKAGPADAMPTIVIPAMGKRGVWVPFMGNNLFAHADSRPVRRSASGGGRQNVFRIGKVKAWLGGELDRCGSKTEGFTRGQSGYRGWPTRIALMIGRHLRLRDLQSPGVGATGS